MLCYKRVRLLTAALFIVALVGGILPGSAQAAQMEMKFTLDSKEYYVNGVKANMDAAPVILENRTLMPIGYVAEPLGAKVEWNEAQQQVRITLKDQTVELWIGKNAAKVNGEEVLIDPQNPKVVPVILPPGRTMLPLRFIAATLGAKLGWNESLLQITVTYPAQPLFESLKPSQANKDATKDFTSYSNQDLDLAIKYPNDWILMERIMAFAVLLKSPDNKSMVTVSTFAKKDLNDFVAVQLDNFKKTMSGFMLIESTTLTMGGLPAHKMVYTYNSDAGVLELMSIDILVNDHIYMVTYGGKVGDFKTNLTTGELIVNSLTI